MVRGHCSLIPYLCLCFYGLLKLLDKISLRQINVEKCKELKDLNQQLMLFHPQNEHPNLQCRPFYLGFSLTTT